ncbi:MAG TPA: chemotaxis response regulator protein-glutamate methylesterase [Desulfuromonadales bacterium]|nr:chemotaxis response regulator protein-glutamate methylesterase [Desulfuromonadales bacterium]
MTVRTNGKIKVLIVDDSSLIRMAIRGILSKDPAFEVVGSAIDGLEGVEKAIALKPDLITLDIEMPRLDGISALKQIMEKAPTKVIIITSQSREDARLTFEGLDAGAVDYILKAKVDAKDAQEAFREELLRKAKETKVSHLVHPAPVTHHGVSGSAVHPARTTPEFQHGTHSEQGGKKINFVCIGASTGGPVALQELLTRIPATFNGGIIVGIHMPRAFIGPYAERLNAKCALTVREAVDGDVLQPGQVLIAPGGMHTSVVRHGTQLVVKTQATGNFPNHVYIPSIDVLLSSMVEATNGALLGVILTGMGNDGFKGMQLLKQRGGSTIVQDEATSTIYGMPKACVIGGVADMVLPIEKIGAEIGKFCP